MADIFYICIKSWVVFMKATIYISGKIGEDTTLVDVIRQFKSYEDPDSVYVVIDSIGGDVDDGEAIYNYLDGLKADLPVNTYAKKAYSIAAKVFAVGQERTIDDEDKALMIHFAWANAKGKAEKFEAIAEVLREIEDDFAAFYSDFLNVDEETVRALLDDETFMSGTEAVDLGFATELKVAAEAVAEYSIKNPKKNTEMTTEKKTLGKKFKAAFDAFMESVDIKAELTLQDSNATDIVFPDLEEGGTPAVGDKATIDGSAIPDGSYIMPSMDDSTLVFVDGAITEVNEAEEEAAETEAEIAARLIVEAAEAAKAEEIKEVFTYSVTSTNTSFEMGDVVMFEGWDGGEEYAASSGEFKLKDGRSIVTDAAGVIVKIKPADSEEQIINVDDETEASFEDMLTKVTEKVTAEVKASLQAELTLKDTEIEDLKKKVGSNEIVPKAQEDRGVRQVKTGESKAAGILEAANLR